jgi:uncharacterized heparinase superfamily protein
VASSPLRVWRTVRHLRRQQVLGQLRRRVLPFLDDPARAAASPAGAYPGCRWPAGLELTAPGARRGDRRVLLAGRFAFLNRGLELGWPPRWDARTPSKLWTYNLHYFEWLWELEFDEARVAVESWIERYPPAAQRPGWDPYPISLRLGNWLGVLFGRHRRRIDADPVFRDRLWSSVARQAAWLAGHAETHLAGNHVLENAAALTVCGSCFEGAAAAAWLVQGRRMLARELAEQLLPDGMHYERSPMYHARMVYLLVQLSSLGHAELRTELGGPLRAAVAALDRLVHPDGELALFNDSAFGIVHPPAELVAAGRRVLGAAAAGEPGPGAWSLPHAGYYGFRDGRGTCLICDAGPIGPDHQPGHAHGDTFSFELSVRGRRVVVDSGVYGYEPDAMRRYCRSTRAHNTVEIEGRDQSEFWGAFRVGRRAVPHDVDWRPGPDGFRLRGWHDGYRHLSGAPRHARELAWSERRLEIADRVEAGRPVRMATRLHLHPDATLRPLDERTWEVALADARLHVALRGPGRAGVEESWYCPEFGRRVPNRALAHHGRGARVDAAIGIEAC